VASRVFLHVGVPKSGTTFLQHGLWSQADRWRRLGVLLPAVGHREHRWGSLVVREDTRRLSERPPAAARAWEEILADVHAWDGTAVVSHEFYGGATRAQARRAVESLAADEVHVVVTARHPLQTLVSGWQEMTKYGRTVALDDFCTGVSDDPHDVWNWRALDAAEVLGHWGAVVPPERVHVVPVASSGQDASLWVRFAGLLAADPPPYPDGGNASNASIGLVECEALRQVGAHLRDLASLPRSTWVRRYLAETVLARRPAERFWPGPDRIAECRERGERVLAQVREAGYDVVGDLSHLAVPAQLPPRRSPADVDPSEVAAVATELVAELVRDLAAERRRALAAERDAGARSTGDAGAGQPPGTPGRGLSGMVRRRLHRRA